MDNYGLKTVKVTEVNISGELPPLLTFDDGSRVTDISGWEKRKKEVIEKGLFMQYGQRPWKPEFLEAEPLADIQREVLPCRITTGTKEKPVSFLMLIRKPEGKGPFPAVIDGDLCFEYAFDSDFVNALLSKGIMLVLFCRTELAPDRRETCFDGQIYRTYPGKYGALAAWSWGYSRCVDALEKLGIVEPGFIAFTGHSRGGKTALVAGAYDERANVVNPNCSGTGGCGCYRVNMKAELPDGSVGRDEELRDLMKSFDYWMSEDIKKYADCTEELPYDSHFVKALIAPRTLLMTEAESDIWANPVGSIITDEAARAVFKLYGKEENIIKHLRPGKHSHKAEDINKLAETLLNSWR